MWLKLLTGIKNSFHIFNLSVINSPMVPNLFITKHNATPTQ